MRFFENGPNIPDQLLHRQDQGRVVFLCGAGISINAGMPSFYKLTKYVVDFFDPPKDSLIESGFRPWIEDEDNENVGNSPKIPLDQIFHQLYQEYGREEVNTLVAKRLMTKNADTDKSLEHHIISRIASNPENKPQIVTTNFDRLFENVAEFSKNQIYEPPAFPDISLGIPLTGITYLHGRLQDEKSDHHPYILSSADFGRAYLSEGWATNFIRSLLKSYTVVLVGYQAEDPPVKYLLQGLNHDGKSDRSNLYAFDKGEIEDIEAKWRDRGVTAIACKDHPSLWQSLEAWADRADDARKWRSNVIKMSMKGPRQLSSHERGQVFHVVRTTPGARLFTHADPSPPPEWLCVFDANCRTGKESHSYSEGTVTFDPLNTYCLDDDPPRPSDSNRGSNIIHDNLFEWRSGDTNPPTSHRLNIQHIARFEILPPRLSHLSNWITKNINSPITVWWVMRQNRLHNKLLDDIRNALRRNTGLHSIARRIWNIILEYQYDNRNFLWDNGWFEINDRIKNEGWTSSVLRDFDKVTSPFLVVDRPLGIRASEPPLKDWDQIGLEELGSWKVKFPDRHSLKLPIPDEILKSIFSIAERHLQCAATLKEELNIYVFMERAECYPGREIDGQDRDRNVTFKWFLRLFKRMVTNFPTNARAYADNWSFDEKYYFVYLKLFALNHAELFTANEAAEKLLSLSLENFWNQDISREILFLIHDRWNDLSKANSIAIVNRLLDGPNKLDHWTEIEYPEMRNMLACRYARWLELQNLVFSKDQKVRLNDMISRIPEWNDRFATNVVIKHCGSSGYISTDETPDQLIDLPINEVVERAQAESQRDISTFTEKRPFIGLVKINPRKALASLSHEARRGKYPKELWATLINEWPDETSPRLLNVFIHRLNRLPFESIRELNYVIGRWIEHKFISAYKLNTHLAWTTFDHLISGLISDKGKATESGVGEVSIGGKVIKRSRRTIDHAINGPIGEAVVGLIQALDSLKLKKGQKIPKEFKSRIEYLYNISGEGSDHTVVLITRNIRWLYYIDPLWVMDEVILWFDFNHIFSEPAWNGFLSIGKFPPEEIGLALKPLFLKLFPIIYHWNWDDDLVDIATQLVIELSIFRHNEKDGFTNKETRLCLRNMNDSSRQQAISRLGNIGEREKNGWIEYVIPFVNEVWPRERKFRTSRLVASWIYLLDRTDKNFPDVFSAISRNLVPVMNQSNWLFKYTKEWVEVRDKSLTAQYPHTVLQLLDKVISDSSDNIPYELNSILDFIVEIDPSLVNDRKFIRLITLVEQS